MTKREILTAIRDNAKRRGYTYCDIAALARVSANTAWRILAGWNDNPTLDTLLRIANVLKLNLNMVTAEKRVTEVENDKL